MKNENEIDLLINNTNAIALDVELDSAAEIEAAEYGNLYQFSDAECDNPEWLFGVEVDMEDIIDRIRERESYELFVANMGGHHD